MSKVQFLELSLTGCTQIDDDTLVSFINASPQLKKLDVSGCRQITGHGWLNLMAEKKEVMQLELIGTSILNKYIVLLQFHAAVSDDFLHFLDECDQYKGENQIPYFTDDAELSSEAIAAIVALINSNKGVFLAFLNCNLYSDCEGIKNALRQRIVDEAVFSTKDLNKYRSLSEAWKHPLIPQPTLNQYLHPQEVKRDDGISYSSSNNENPSGTAKVLPTRRAISLPTAQSSYFFLNPKKSNYSRKGKEPMEDSSTFNRRRNSM